MCDVKFYRVTMHERNCTILYIILKILQTDFQNFQTGKAQDKCKATEVLSATNFYFHLFCVLFFILFGVLSLVFGRSGGFWVLQVCGGFWCLFEVFLFVFIALTGPQISEDFVFMKFLLLSGRQFRYL